MDLIELSINMRELPSALFFSVYDLLGKERTEGLPYSHLRRIRRGLRRLRQEGGET